MEKQVVAGNGDYTTAMQLKARYEVLKERQLLKYAALDCWQLVAQELPPGISLQRSSFVDGRKVSLNGQVAADAIPNIINFYDKLRKVKLNGLPVFDPNSGEQLTYRQTGNQVSWNFSLELLHPEGETR